MSSEFNKDAFDLLKQIIAIPSPSKDEGQVCSFLYDWLYSHGYFPKREGNNIWLRSDAGNDLPGILICSHLDTIKPSGDWIYDPFIPVDTEERIIGLGSVDAGASVVSMIAAFMMLDRVKDRKYNLILALTAEQEIYGNNGIESVYASFGRVDLAIVGEPTSLKLAVSERGLLILDCISYGKASHVAHKNGENAILKALADISILQNINFEKISPYLGKVELEVTQISGGIQHNIIPDKCSFVVDIRTNELYAHEEIVDIIGREISAEIVPRSLRLRSSFIHENHSLLVRAREMGIETTGSGTISDMALIPCPSVKIGPGDPLRSNKPDEYILKSEIIDGIQLYYNLLTNYQL